LPYILRALSESIGSRASCLSFIIKLEDGRLSIGAA
jgi:hypothetical protein